MLFKRKFLILLSFDPDPTTRHTFWALVIGGMINWAGTYGASQASIQRFSSLPTLRDAKRYINPFILLHCISVNAVLTCPLIHMKLISYTRR